METLGQVLHRYRTEGQFTAESFAQLTKIPPKMIAAIESDSFRDLPGDFYVRGYIKTYARYLNLNYKKLIEHYQRQIGGLVSAVNPGATVNYKVSEAVITPRRIKLTAILVTAVLLIGYLVVQVNKIFKPPFLEVTYPSENIVTTDTFISIRGTAERESRVFINNKEIFADSRGFYTATLDLNKGINLIKVSAKKTHSGERVIFREILVQ